MKLMSMQQYGKMTKASLVRKIMKALKKLPKTRLAKICYQLEKSRLPSITVTASRGRKGMPKLSARRGLQPRRLRALTPKRRKTRRTGKKRKLRRLVKGSPEAKRYMAKIRRMKR